VTDDEAIAGLNALPFDDQETAHIRADDILVAVLKQLAPNVAAAWEEAAKRIGFWYA
jgi:hypothetical protein